MAKRLYRSTTDMVIAGVCGGLGKSLGIDPAFIRLFFVLGVWAGFSLLIYPMLWLILPREDQMEASTEETLRAGAEEIAEQARSFGETMRTHSIRAKAQNHGRNTEVAGIFFGCLLVLVGISALADTLHLYFVSFDLVWPLALIAGGLLLLQRRIKTA